MNAGGLSNGRPRGLPVYKMLLGGLYAAFFALCSNVIPPITLIPGVPITLQIFVVAMMGLTLGVRFGLLSYTAVLLLTLCGLPMMSGGRGGPAVLAGPTGGYALGFLFIVLLTGLYSTYCMGRLLRLGRRGLLLHLPLSFAAGMLGVGLDYLCGSAGLMLYNGQPAAALPALFAANLVFLPGEVIKIAAAAGLSAALFSLPAFRRYIGALRS